MSRLHARTNVLGAFASNAALQVWRRIIGLVGSNWRQRAEHGSDPELSYLQAIARVRTDPLEVSERRLAQFLEAHPGSFHVMEEHAAILDRLGHRDVALARYGLARHGRQRVKRGMPDRPYFMRHRTTSVAEINGYTRASRALGAKRGAFPYVARGHAYLMTRRPRLALIDYDLALTLKPDQTHLLVARGEALAALGRYAEALQALDRAVAANPKDADALGSRAIVRLALGRIADADADWLRQLELLPGERHDARACVWLRLASYEMALNELERAVVRNPDDSYLRLYYLAAARRLRLPVQQASAATNGWPGPMIAFHEGKLAAADVLQLADNPGRRAEALFQLGMRACDGDPDETRQWWSQVVEMAAPDTIEYAAARHELEKPVRASQAISLAPATAGQMITEATS